MNEKFFPVVHKTSQWVRIIGDPILHSPGIQFPHDYTESDHQELQRQIDIAKSILIKTGGGGIAANQCLAIQKPYQFAIVGVFYESEEHVAGVSERYPSVQFPQAMIMVNPVILEQSDQIQLFNHGCLSVPCPNRCTVQSPEELTVEYLDPTQGLISVKTTLTGKAAVALWHEMNHILDGKTYIDTALRSLSKEDLIAFESLVKEEMTKRRPHQAAPEFTVPPFYFSITIDEKNNAQLNQDVLREVLPKMTLETLLGIVTQCNLLTNGFDDTEQLSSNLIIF